MEKVNIAFQAGKKKIRVSKIIIIRPENQDCSSSNKYKRLTRKRHGAIKTSKQSFVTSR